MWRLYFLRMDGKVKFQLLKMSKNVIAWKRTELYFLFLSKGDIYNCLSPLTVFTVLVQPLKLCEYKGIPVIICKDRFGVFSMLKKSRKSEASESPKSAKCLVLEKFHSRKAYEQSGLPISFEHGSLLVPSQEAAQVWLWFSLPEKRFFRRSRSGEILAKNPVVRSKSYNNPLLTPVAEYDSESAAASGASIRRHSVSEVSSCLQLQGYPGLAPGTDSGSRASVAAGKGSLPGEQPGIAPGQQKGLLRSPGDPHGSVQLGTDAALLPAPSSSPENVVDQILESIDSDSEGIFIDFGRGCSSSSAYSVDVNRQSIVWGMLGDKQWGLIKYGSYWDSALDCRWYPPTNSGA